MKRCAERTIRWTALALLAGVVTACDVAKEHHEVMMESLTFSPARLTVSAGDTVTWINRDLVPHTATSLRGGGGAAPGRADFDSNALIAGASFSVVLTEPGEYAYTCAYHPMMNGVVVVR